MGKYILKMIDEETELNRKIVKAEKVLEGNPYR